MIKSIFQTEEWTKFKALVGWRSKHFGDFIGMERILVAGKTMQYFPEIPLNEKCEHLIKKIHQDTTVSDRIFSRFEFLELWTPDKAGALVELGLLKAFEDVQPDYRQWVLLDKTEEELLKEMKPKGRYNIRVAERHNLTIDWGISEKEVKTFFDLYAHTSKRTGFQGRNLAYFQQLINALAPSKLAEIVVISHKGEPLSAGIITFYGGVASYLYGGSGGDRSFMAPYLMHWAAIKRAKREGFAIYDLLAIAPPDKPEHVHASLTRFKTQFGGQSVRLLGSWDLVHNRLWYTLYKFAQKRRRRAI